MPSLGGRKEGGSADYVGQGEGLPLFFFLFLFPVTCVGETIAGETTVGEVVLLCPFASGRR